MGLQSDALDRFDRLSKSGDLLWKDVTPRHLCAQPFDFEFRVAESLISKPQDTEQKRPTNTARGAFDDDNPDFELGRVGRHHRLILNKFSVVRPQFVVPTASYEPQSDALNIADFEAVWEVLAGLDDHYMAIFNCGIDAGSSVGHKHLQVIPLPERYDRGFLTVLLEQIKAEDTQESGQQHRVHALVGAPFKHAACHISSDMTPSELVEIWNLLYKSVGLAKGQAHNLLLTKNLIVAVPRVKAWMGEGDDVFSCNAAGLAGIVWCKTEAQYQAWLKYGPMEALRDFGIDAIS